MRIINQNAGIITNFEVNRVLEVQKIRGKAQKRGTKDMVFVEKQVGHYLYHNSLVRRQTEESIAAFLEGSAQYNLTLAEQLQLINLCPTTLVEVYLSIDEAEHRLGEENMADLLNLIMETLYLPEDQVPASVNDDEPILKEQKKNPNRDRNGGRGRGGKRGGRGGHKGQHGGRGRGAPRDRK